MLIKHKRDVKPEELFSLVTDECFCSIFNEEKQDWEPAKECNGDCGKNLLEDFVQEASKHFRPRTWATFWPTWQGMQPITVTFKTVTDIPRIMAPSGNSWYNMKWGLVKEPGRGNKRVWIALWLVHHDGARMYFF